MISHSKEQKREQWKKECIFCKEKSVPTFKDHLKLKKFLTERGKILPRGRTGLCTKHQKLLTTSIKQARQLVLLPYTAG